MLYLVLSSLLDPQDYPVSHRIKLNLLCTLYTIVNLFICHKFVYLEKLGFLFKDGILLPLILSIYLYDQVTINVVATCFPVVLALFNVGMIREIHQRTVKP